MKVFLIISVIFINYVLCEHSLPHKSRALLYPKKVMPSGKRQIHYSGKYMKKLGTKTSLDDIKKYTVFPLGTVPDSPFFLMEQNSDNKPRVKKVLPTYMGSSIRNKRSAVLKTEAKVDTRLPTEKKQKEIVVTHNTSKTNMAKRDNNKKSLLKRSRSRTNLHDNYKAKQKQKKEAKNARTHKKMKKNKNRINHQHDNLKFSKRPNKRISNIKHAKSNKKSKREGSHKIKKLTNNKSSKSEIKNHPKKVNARRVIAGKDALIEDYPYVVSIQKGHQHWCAGALLNPRLVVTTANCIWKASHISRLRVRAGSRYTDRGGQVTKIQEVMRHPGWSIRKNPDNDLALLLLDKHIKFSHSVHDVDLPNRVMMPAFDDAWITSWGAERRDGVYDSKGITLRVYHARILDRKKCNNVTQRFGVPVTDNFICLAQTGQRGPCTRDTGAPAVSDGVLWGLASWGIRKLCGTERYPAMFSYLASQSNLDFIINATQYLMSDERHYPFLDRYPTVRASPTTPTVLTLPF